MGHNLLCIDQLSRLIDEGVISDQLLDPRIEALEAKFTHVTRILFKVFTPGK
jgi:hypothetical protein